MKGFLKKAAPTILTCLGSAGVIATAVVAVKATPKAQELLAEAKQEKEGELTKIETVRAIIPAYWPSVAIGLSTIACIVSANLLNRHSQAALAGAYALLESSYKEYKNKAKDVYGDDADKTIKQKMAEDRYEVDDSEDQEDSQLFFDFNTLQYFRSTMGEVVQKVEMEDGMECYIINTPFSSSY